MIPLFFYIYIFFLIIGNQYLITSSDYEPILDTVIPTWFDCIYLECVALSNHFLFSTNDGNYDPSYMTLYKNELDG